jgi:hypothetical protein
MAHAPERQASQDYMDRLRETIEIKLKLRAALLSDAARQDNEQQLHRAEDALAAEMETN